MGSQFIRYFLLGFLLNPVLWIAIYNLLTR